jgi:hypothetical protein
MDRTAATGTGYVNQYRASVAKMYESPGTTPDELLLFFHHVPYTYALSSGKTVIQHIYDSHYAGAQLAAGFVNQWKTLKGRVDEERYAEVLKRLEYQAGHAIVWRDAVCNWFFQISGLADKLGRVGHYPGRIEVHVKLLRAERGLNARFQWKNAPRPFPSRERWASTKWISSILTKITVSRSFGCWLEIKSSMNGSLTIICRRRSRTATRPLGAASLASRFAPATPFASKAFRMVRSTQR